MRRLAKLCCLLGVLTTSAQALMAPEYYRQAREKAPYHVQVAVTGVVTPKSGPGSCMVDGKVAQIFKGASSRLADGMPIRFSVACYRAGDKVPIGGTMWTDVAGLEKAGYIEVYLDDAGSGFDTALWQSRIIDAPSSTPQFPVD